MTLYVTTMDINILTVKDDETVNVDRSTRIVYQGEDYEGALRAVNMWEQFCMNLGESSETLTVAGDNSRTGQTHINGKVHQWEIEILQF